MSKNRYKARTPVQSRGIVTRNRIIDAAQDLFGKNGYHRTNALQIAAHAGLATGTFYSYFNNKKEVLIEIIKRFYTETAQKVFYYYNSSSSGIKDDPFKAGKKLVHIMITSLYEAHRINPSLHRELVALSLLDDELMDINRKEETRVLEFLTSLLSSVRDVLHVSDLEAAAFLLYRTAEDVIHRLRIIGTDIESERMLAELEDMICAYLFGKG